MKFETVDIIAARRTPLGAFLGELSTVSATDLAAASTRTAIADCGIDAAEIDEVLLGCVLPAGLGQAPARQAAIAAGIPVGIPCTTVNKVCGSGMKTTMLAYDLIRAASGKIVISGGMESMSNAPYLMPKARSGYRMGHQEVLDHMFYDGLQSPFDGNMMGHFAELTARKYEFSRQDQDEFAVESVTRAKAAIESGGFDDEIAAVRVKTRKSEHVVSIDEVPRQTDIQKIPQLRPAFAKDGTVTAATLILMSSSETTKRELTPLATIVGHSGFAQEPEWFTTSPVFAIKALLNKLDWTRESVDLFEINEAFACVTMAAMHDVGLPHEKVNVNGGACALGHPIGASGARIIVTLIHALRARNGGRGIASLCIGGGEAVAIAIEVPAQ
jgi:acetyl-CoA C-acetyltransferase